MNEFFSMGGYAAYVWPAYVVTVVVLVGNVWLATRQHNNRLDAARAYAARRQRAGSDT